MSLEQQINKATDPALTSDNWQYVLDVCDTISSDPEHNIRKLMGLVKTRLALTDANIMLRTLTLLVVMGENCGSRMQLEIASLAFLKTCLLSRLADKKVHKELKFRIAEVIEQLDRLFKKDPSLKAIADAYATVKSKYPQYLKLPPSKPAKTRLTVKDKQKEDLELERALKLSVQEYEREQTIRKSHLDDKPLPAPYNETRNGTQNNPFSRRGSTGNHAANAAANDETHTGNGENTLSIASVKKVYALYDLISYEPDELSFRKGDIITVIESVYRDWWRGSLTNGKIGIFPLNYVTPVVSKSSEELARELKLESALVELELKKVDRLLVLLSLDPNSVLEEEMTELYNSIVPLKPVLAQLIGKHCARKDELKVLNDQVGAETRLYNSLIDSVIAQRKNTHLNYSLPYPSLSQNQLQHQNHQNRFQNQPQPQSQPYYEQPLAVTPGSYLDQQPTSAGFGNSANFTGLRPSYEHESPSRQNNQYDQQQNHNEQRPQQQHHQQHHQRHDQQHSQQRPQQQRQQRQQSYSQGGYPPPTSFPQRENY